MRKKDKDFRKKKHRNGGKSFKKCENQGMNQEKYAAH